MESRIAGICSDTLSELKKDLKNILESEQDIEKDLATTYNHLYQLERSVSAYAQSARSEREIFLAVKSECTELMNSIVVSQEALEEAIMKSLANTVEIGESAITNLMNLIAAQAIDAAGDAIGGLPDGQGGTIGQGGTGTYDSLCAEGTTKYDAKTFGYIPALIRVTEEGINHAPSENSKCSNTVFTI